MHPPCVLVRQGFSTGLPERLQLALLQTLPGLGRVKMLRPAYAVEYDYLPAHQCHGTLETKKIRGLFFSGQLNGTTGAVRMVASAELNAGLRAPGDLDYLSSVVTRGKGSVSAWQRLEIGCFIAAGARRASASVCSYGVLPHPIHLLVLLAQPRPITNGEPAPHPQATRRPLRRACCRASTRPAGRRAWPP